MQKTKAWYTRHHTDSKTKEKTFLQCGRATLIHHCKTKTSSTVGGKRFKSESVIKICQIYLKAFILLFKGRSLWQFIKKNIRVSFLFHPNRKLYLQYPPFAGRQYLQWALQTQAVASYSLRIHACTSKQKPLTSSKQCYCLTNSLAFVKKVFTFFANSICKVSWHTGSILVCCGLGFESQSLLSL